jgi:hypothetical protein
LQIIVKEISGSMTPPVNFLVLVEFKRGVLEIEDQTMETY